MGRARVTGRRTQGGAIAALACALVALGGIASGTLPATAAEAGSAQCEPQAPAPDKPRVINLVIDDSGSMFSNGRSPLDRWSFAKYSLEVFAAMMGPQDTLNVYRMSDFNEDATGTVAVTIDGSQDRASRVSAIHEMPLAGGGTPYPSVQKAAGDLAATEGDDKWLVVLSDGKFDGVPSARVRADLARFIEANPSTRVAFMSIGDEAQSIPNAPEQGINSARVVGEEDLLAQMTSFANLIFNRAREDVPIGGSWAPDVALGETLVFAQGPEVSIGSAGTKGGAVQPASVVEVAWAENDPVDYDDRPVPAKPNTRLQGALAQYDGLPEGEVTFDVANAKTMAVFYKPQVNFGLELRNEAGEVVPAGDIVNGTYTVRYGFQDDECAFIDSKLLGQVEYSARVIRDGEVVNPDFTSGDTVELGRGDTVIEVEARYLDGNTAKASLPLRVVPKALPATLEAEDRQYLVSTLGDFPPVSDGVALFYVIEENGVERPPTQEEWDSLQESDIVATSDANLELEVRKLDAIGSVVLLPRAPGGDVFAADTGTFDVTVSATRELEGQTDSTSATVPLTVIDDLSAADRLAHWFSTVGWKLLLLVLLLILLLGYLLKRRFSKRVKSRPTISGTPRQVGMSSEDSYGKFRRNGVRRWLPFVADTATLTYVPPGVIGFRPMRLKAGPRKSMVLVNWKQIAEKANTEINGTPLDQESRRGPTFGPNATIVASTNQMTYEMTPSA